jgi:hypothetical protein
MRDTLDLNRIQSDWDVYSSDGANLGTVVEVGPSYVLVQKGLIFVHDTYVPRSAISRVDDGAVYLTLSKDELQSRDWSQPPTDDMGTDYVTSPRTGRTDAYATGGTTYPAGTRTDTYDDRDRGEVGAEAAGAGVGALGGAVIGGAIAGPPGAIVGGIAGAAGGAAVGESTEGDDEAGSAAGGAGGSVAGAVIGGAIAGPPGAVVGGAVGAGAGAGLGDKAEEDVKDDEFTKDRRIR